jgi:hypothetical protein
MQVRDRIQEFKRVPGSMIRPNPKNWRLHPDAQREALRGIFAEVGIADALLVRPLDDGSYQLIDGHCRAEELPPGQEVPILVLDVSDDEADKLLLTFDPLAELATRNTDALDALAKSVSTESPAIKSMIEGLASAPTIATQTGETDPDAEWQGMPSYDGQEPCFRKIVVNFDSQEDVDAFLSLIGQQITAKTKSIWYPAKERRDLDAMRWTDDEGGEHVDE